jgi:hypothetical protein
MIDRLSVAISVVKLLCDLPDLVVNDGREARTKADRLCGRR